MWIVVEDGAILEAPRLALVGVADDRLRFTGGFGDGAPLLSGGEAGAAPTGESALCDNVDQLLGTQLAYSSLERFVSASGAIPHNAGATRLPYACKDALFGTSRILRGQRRRSIGELAIAATDEQFVTPEDGNRLVASAGTGHVGGPLFAK